MDSNIKEYKKGDIEFFKFFGYITFHRILAIIIILIKLLPLMSITHDWKISSYSGIAYYLRKFTFSEIIYDFNSVFLSNFILSVNFFLIIRIVIIIIKVKFYEHSIDLYHSFLEKSTFLLYTFNVYFYSFYTEIIFNDKIKNEVSSRVYYLQIGIICLCLIFMIILDMLFTSVLIKEPCFIGNTSILTNEM